MRWMAMLGCWAGLWAQSATTGALEGTVRDAAGVHRVRFALRLDPEEHVVGFGERYDAVDQRGAPADLDIGAHAPQLGHVHVAILENRFLEEAFALGDGQHGHELCLHVGRESRERRGRQSQGTKGTIGGDLHALLAKLDHQS